MNPLSHTPAATASRSGRLATRGLPQSRLCGQQQPGMRSAGSRQYEQQADYGRGASDSRQGVLRPDMIAYFP